MCYFSSDNHIFLISLYAHLVQFNLEKCWLLALSMYLGTCETRCACIYICMYVCMVQWICTVWCLNCCPGYLKGCCSVVNFIWLIWFGLLLHILLWRPIKRENIITVYKSYFSCLFHLSYVWKYNKPDQKNVQLPAQQSMKAKTGWPETN